MSNARVAMMTMKESQIEGTLYINGQVIVGKCRFIMPEFAANSEDASTQRKREQLLIDRALEENPDLVSTPPASYTTKKIRRPPMTAKKDCTKTICPLCERKCQAGSTDSGFIENNGACLRCVFGKTQEQIKELIAAKGKNAKLKNNIKKGGFVGIDLGTKGDTSALLLIKLNESKCIEKIDVSELNSVEIDNNNCNCAACQHRKNIDERKAKSPAIFEGYEVNAEFIRNENAYFDDGGYAEEVTIKKTWQKPDGSAWVTFLSNMRMGFLDMQLADFAKKYKVKTKADEPALASDGKRYFYIVFSCNGGGKKGFKRGYTCIQTFNNKMFSIEKLSKEIKQILSFQGKKVKDILITNWRELNKNDYKQLTDDENETPCKLL